MSLLGALLSSYRFDRWITDKNKRAPVSFVPLQSLSDEEQEEWQRGTIAAEAQNLARTWMNAPANTMTPKDFVSEAERVLSSTGSQCDIIVHEEEWMSKMKMNAFLSVAKGSIEPPKFLEIHIRNAPQVSSAHLALVGKGITYAYFMSC
jgi:aminopeptidase